MRSLNTSLPAAPSGRQPPPEQLLQAFKTAALSVTNLYKAAVTDQSNSRAAGYQDALDDLMKFLDQGNLGLQDGEGWRVRQWVSERFDGTANQPQTDVEDARYQAEQRASSAPPPNHLPTEQQSMQPPTAVADNKKEHQASTTETAAVEPVFRFTAGMDALPPSTHSNNEAEQSSSPVRVEVINHGARTPHRQRHAARSSNREFPFLAGTKRKLQFPDFFDITNIGQGDGSGGGNKRGRFA